MELQLIIEHDVRVIEVDEDLQHIAPPLSPEVCITEKVQPVNVVIVEIVGREVPVNVHPSYEGVSQLVLENKDERDD